MLLRCAVQRGWVLLFLLGRGHKVLIKFVVVFKGHILRCLARGLFVVYVFRGALVVERLADRAVSFFVVPRGGTHHAAIRLLTAVTDLVAVVPGSPVVLACCRRFRQWVV